MISISEEFKLKNPKVAEFLRNNQSSIGGKSPYDACGVRRHY